MPLKGEFGSLCLRSIGRMPSAPNLLSLDASLVILTRVLCFEVSGLRRRTPVRPVHLTSQTGTHRPDRSNAIAPPSTVLRFFGLGFVDQPRNPVVFW
jgi:hypothetical protein